MTPPILLYDGHCALCNGFVKFLLRFDRKEIFRFAAIDSNLASQLHNLYPWDREIDSVVLIANGKVYLYDEVAFEVIRQLGYPFKAALILKIIPGFIRKAIYKTIAKYRYRIWGKYAVCPLPPLTKRHLFIQKNDVTG